MSYQLREIDYVARTREAILSRTNTNAGSLRESHRELWALVWANPFGLHPQKILDTYAGGEALKMFRMSTLTVEFIRAIEALDGVPEAERYNPLFLYAFTVDQATGEIVVGELHPEPVPFFPAA